MSDPAPRFSPGERVRVHARHPPGHVRTPWYCRGKTGEIERVCGRFRNPEQLAYGQRDADREVLYRVRFPIRAIWPDEGGGAGDCVEVEIYEPWLGPAPGAAK